MKARILFLTLASTVAGSAAGQLVETRDEEGNRLFQMTVRPATEPTPRLRYRLMTADRDLQPGNAATYWYRAVMDLHQDSRHAGQHLGKRLAEKGLVGGADDPAAFNRLGYDTLDSWQLPRRLPLSEIPLDLAKPSRDSLLLYRREEADRASRRERCDWGLETRQLAGMQLASFMLPEFQQMRSLSDALCLDERIAIAEGRLDDAIDSLRIHFELCRDAASPPLLVCRLIGDAVARHARAVLRDLQCHPDAPSLYWALADLPRPFIDLREAIRFEAAAVFRVHALLRDPESADRSDSEWHRLLNECLDGPKQIALEDPGAAATDPLVIWIEGLRDAGPDHPGVRLARQRLLDRGFEASRIDAMPVAQLLAIDAAHVYSVLSDALEAAFQLPWPEGEAALEEAYQWRKAADPLGEAPHREVLPIAKLLPGFQYVVIRTSPIETERGFAALRLIEALRLHAGETGEFPEALDEITCVPVPLNPATGQAFDYHRDGEVARVMLTKEELKHFAGEQYEVRLAD